MGPRNRNRQVLRAVEEVRRRTAPQSKAEHPPPHALCADGSGCASWKHDLWPFVFCAATFLALSRVVARETAKGAPEASFLPDGIIPGLPNTNASVRPDVRFLMRGREKSCSAPRPQTPRMQQRVTGDALHALARIHIGLPGRKLCRLRPRAMHCFRLPQLQLLSWHGRGPCRAVS